MSLLMQDKFFVSALKCSFHSPQSLSRHFDNTQSYRWLIIFETILNHLRLLFVENESPVKPSY